MGPDAPRLARARARARAHPGVTGAILAAVSASAFGVMPVLAKLGYEAGLQPEQLLALRFALAVMLIAPVTAAVAGRDGWLSRDLTAVALGQGVLFGVQSLCFFWALVSLDASVGQLVFFLHPGLVALGARVVLGHETSRLLLVALGVSGIGIALVVGGGSLHAGGVALALTSAALYAGYILIGDSMLAGASPLVTSTLTLVGAAVALQVASALAGGVTLPGSGRAWWLLGVLALVPLVAIPTLFMALPRIGPTRASLIGCCEPVVTVAVAALTLGDRMRLIQVIGSALVIGAVMLVIPARGRRETLVPPVASGVE